MLGSFSVAQSGLAAANTQVENVMNNIANEDTEGYKKRVVSVSESEQFDSNITGSGATVDGINRVTNIYMYDNLIDQDSKKSEYDELSVMLDDIESIFYETEDSGMSNDLDNYYQSIENLRADPNNEIYKDDLKNKGNVLVDDLQTLYAGIEDREKTTTNSMSDDVDNINSILNDIGNVNQQISDSINPSNDLYDKRDQLESRLSEYVEIDVDRTDPYTLSIGGMTAVRYNTNVHDVQLADDKVAKKDVYAKDTDAAQNVSTLVDPDTWGDTDTVTYYFDKDISVTVTNGETLSESDLNYDINGDGDTSDDVTVDKDNVVRAMVAKINTNPDLSNSIKAYNGQYSIDKDGNKVPQSPTDEDHYLMIESITPGIEGDFESRIVVDDNDHTDDNGDQVAYIQSQSDIKSKKATNDIHLEIFDEELDIKTGSSKSKLDNIDTTSDSNKFTEYKDLLDNFAKTLSDMSEAYIDEGDGNYVSGEQNSLLAKDSADMQKIGLFSGASVKTLKFNDDVVSGLDQDKLDYLATLQWNDEVSFDDSGDKSSFSKYLQKIKVTVSSDKENVDYMAETQTAVTESLQTSYDKYTKVNKDDELINLTKYQAAYEANAKVITTLDEMLQTLLGMKR
jgi:flagellar hook-associated protein 1 FlgK